MERKISGDAVIFESSARLDIPKIQQALSDDQILLHYMQLTDQLVIVCISKDRVDSTIVNVSKKDIDNTIKTNFLVNYIELYGHNTDPTKEEDQQYMQNAIAILSDLYTWLIKPVHNKIINKKLYLFFYWRIYIPGSILCPHILS